MKSQHQWPLKLRFHPSLPIDRRRCINQSALSCHACIYPNTLKGLLYKGAISTCHCFAACVLNTTSLAPCKMSGTRAPTYLPSSAPAELGFSAARAWRADSKLTIYGPRYSPTFRLPALPYLTQRCNEPAKLSYRGVILLMGRMVERFFPSPQVPQRDHSIRFFDNIR